MYKQRGSVTNTENCKTEDTATDNSKQTTEKPSRLMILFSVVCRRFIPVKIEGLQHTPPPAEQVKPLLLRAMKWYSANKQKSHPFELACLIHHKVAWIHPFEDGNGRTARAATNFLLMKKGYPMFFIPVEKRQAYHEALDAADSGDEKTYVSQMLRLVIDQVRSYGKEKETKSKARV